MPLDVKRLVLVEQLIPEMKIKTNNNSNKALSSSVVSPASSTHPLLLKERFRSTLQERIEAAAAAHQSKQPAIYPAKIAADDNNSKPKDQGLLHTAQQLSSDLKDLVQQCVPIDVVGDHPRDCLLYTSDAADEEDSVDLGGRRIIKKKKRKKETRARK
eukprot:TRINITY_DN16193_c0_g1_i1.p1 TRINITY_DN16193_c0_g1~~TRINITY_DN16193_c0_g1_i1.p1  ORF type:complete len:158 (-),score=46.68 TRINITY_DN16193_c0_g1_i1:89-562(-)